NQLDETDNAHGMHWMPRELPVNVKVVASCIDEPGKNEPVLRAMRGRKAHRIRLDPLTDQERFGIVTEVPSLSAKTLNPSQVQALLNNPATRNPLFLLVALEELRGFGSYELLDARIKALPTGEDAVILLFAQVLERLELEFDAENVRTLLSLLAAARRGLSERELLELVEGHGDRTRSRSDLFPILRQLRGYLQNRSGLLNFFHRSLHEAARARYLDTPDALQNACKRLADYFERGPVTGHSNDELPWLLRKLHDRGRLRSCVLAMPRFRGIFNQDPIELRGYWIWLGEERVMGASYLEAYESWRVSSSPATEDMIHAGNEVAAFLSDAWLHNEAESLYRRVLEICEDSGAPDNDRVASICSNLGEALRKAGRARDAEPFLVRAVRIMESNGPGDPSRYAKAVNNYGLVLLATGRPTEAEPFFRRALGIAERAHGPGHPDVARYLNNLALVFAANKRPDEAESFYHRAMAVWEGVYGPDHPEVANALYDRAVL
ncbi:MAG TPA: tetratricopeptide repeat protein, partial [Candidatus Hydrogenedentes bacterium]|nr:tetratricopeptide repeat protein [Candidatus Hydrogenedentota bacterium]